jgi:hypothetical protein
MKGNAARVLAVSILILLPLPAVMGQGFGSRTAGPASLQASRQMPPVRALLVDPGPVGLATTTALFAHVAVGGGWNTVFTFVNTGSTDISGNLILTANDGTPLSVVLADPAAGTQAGTTGGPVEAVGSSVPISIPVGGITVMAATPVGSSDPTKTGWARIESSGGQIGGVATFQLFDSNGNLTTAAGVLSADAVSAATIPVDNDNAQNRQVGYALANPSNVPLTIKAVVLDNAGNVQKSFTIQLAPGAQTAAFLWQNDASFLKFRGTLVLISQSSTNFSVTSLVQNGSLYTAIPVIPSKDPNVN